MNMGAFAHVAPRLATCMRTEGRHLPDHIPYAGRGPSASTATGFGSVHAQEQVRAPLLLPLHAPCKPPMQLVPLCFT